MKKLKINKNELITTIQNNCKISDSKENLDLIEPKYLLTQQYFFENKIYFTEKIRKIAFLKYITKKKEDLNKYTNKKYQKININGIKYNIYDYEKINKILIPHKLFYAVRDVNWNNVTKPSFLFAEIKCIKKINNQKIYFLGQELAKDLRRSFYSAAEKLDPYIFCRTYAEEYIVIQRFLEVLKKNKKNKLLKLAFKKYGVNKNLNYKIISKIINDELMSYCYHELGHKYAEKHYFSKSRFLKLYDKYKNSNKLWIIYAYHEIFADFGDLGRLKYILKQKNKGLFLFYLQDIIQNHKIHEISNIYYKQLTKTNMPDLEEFIEFNTIKMNNFREKVLLKTIEDLKSFK